MTNKEFREKLLSELRKLISIFDKHDIWYSAEAGTMLGAVRDNKLIEWDDDIDLMITYDGYKKLKKLFPNNVLDNDNPEYPLLFPKWIDNVKNFNHKDKNVVIDLFLLVPTTKKRFNKKYRTFLNKLRFSIQVLNRSRFNAYMLPLKILKFFQIPLMPFIRKKMTIESAFELLHEKDKKNASAHVILVNPTDKFNKKRTLVGDMSTTKIDFEGMKLSVLSNHKKILENRYGENWRTPIEPKRHVEHITALSIKYKK